jgi:hypothetical protein
MWGIAGRRDSLRDGRFCIADLTDSTCYAPQLLTSRAFGGNDSIFFRRQEGSKLQGGGLRRAAASSGMIVFPHMVVPLFVDCGSGEASVDDQIRAWPGGAFPLAWQLRAGARRSLGRPCIRFSG